MPDIRGQGSEDRGQKAEDRSFVAAMRQSSDKGAAKPPNALSSVFCPLSSAPCPLSSETFLAFDFGTRRIGIAMGNALLRHAKPLLTLDDEKTDTRFAKIAALLEEWRPDVLVVGLPGNDDGTPHELTALCRRFANRLKGRFKLPVILVDERYTSLSASAQLKEEGIHGKKQKMLIDQYAAQQILQAYFDEPLAGQTV